MASADLELVRGKASGVKLEQLQVNGATLFEVAHGKVTRIVQYFDRDDALADLGLKPEAPRS